AGIGDDDDRRGQWLALGLAPALVMLRAAAMPEPTHQRRVAPGHLHAVDAEVESVLARCAWAFGHDKRPGDQRRRLVGPAGLDRQQPKIDLGAAQDDFLTSA